MVTSAGVARGLMMPLPGQGLELSVCRGGGVVTRLTGGEEDGGCAMLKAQQVPTRVHTGRWTGHPALWAGGDGRQAIHRQRFPLALTCELQVGRLSSLAILPVGSSHLHPKAEAKALRPLSFLEGRVEFPLP